MINIFCININIYVTVEPDLSINLFHEKITGYAMQTA